jgi:endo-1,4-beta-xylanase
MKNRSLPPRLCAVFMLSILLQPLRSEITIPEGGEEMHCIPTAFANKHSGTSVQTSAGWAVSVAETVGPPPSNPDDRIGLRLEFPEQEIKAQERLFGIIKARVRADYGEINIKLNRAGDSKVFLAKRFPVYVGTDWMEVPFAIASYESAKPPVITLGMGARAQDLEIESVRVFRYPAGHDMARLNLQKTSYRGREEGSPWRAEALRRIETIRKGDFVVHLSDPEGKPLGTGSIQADLIRHSFRFGSAVSADLLAASGNDADRYRTLIDRLFSAVVFENDLKPQMYDKRKEKRQMAALDSAIQWLHDHRIQLRGHYLFQNAINSTMPQQIKELGMPKFCENLRHSIRERIDHVGNRVCEWDAENHPIAWPSAKVLTQTPGFESLGEDLMREIAKLTQLPLVVNEDNLSELKERQAYATWDHLKRYKDLGIKVDKLGHQAHYHLSNLISPEDFLKVADHYAEIVPAQVVTEFDILTNGDDQLAADFTRDLMTAVFSHPAFDGFLSWGFWEGKAHHGDGMPWRKDWSARPCGEMLEELLGKTWRTRIETTSDDGGLAFRGFYGRYTIHYAAGGIALRGEVELTPTAREVNLVLNPEP